MTVLGVDVYVVMSFFFVRCCGHDIASLRSAEEAKKSILRDRGKEKNLEARDYAGLAGRIVADAAGSSRRA